MGVMKVIELMAESEKSWEDATKQAVKRAAGSVHSIKSAWVQDQSVSIKDGEVIGYRVTVKVSFEVK